MKTGLFCLIISIFSIQITAQQVNTGIISDNYVSSNIATYNPSSIVDSKTKIAFTSSLNFFSLSNFFSKNYFWASTFSNSFTGGSDGKFVEHKRAGYKNNNFNVDIVNFKYEINHQNAVAYTYRLRSFLTQNGLPQIWSKNSVNDKSQLILNSPESIAGLRLSELAFTEHVFSFARTIFDQKSSFLKAGISLKLLNGLESNYFYVNSGTASFTQVNNDLLDVSNMEAEFGQNASKGQQYYKNRGVGLDLGITYEIRPKYEKQYYEMDGRSKNIRYDINKYKYKFGASITDIGSIRFMKDSSSYNFANPSAQIYSNDLFNINGYYVPSQIKSQLQYKGTKSANQDPKYKMSLPTSLNLSADYYYKKNMYVSYSVSIPLSLPNDKTKVSYGFIQTITPRIETANYSFMLPISQQGNGKFYLGMAGRMNINKISFFAGSSNLNWLLGQKASLGRSFFAGVSYNFLYTIPSDIDDDKISDEKDVCPDDKGLLEYEGCPDTDGDEIPDKEDLCIYNAGPRETNGCPDKDSDGIIDMNDMCPSVPGLGVHYGCPDRDFDGVIDMADKCPDVPGVELNNGCPFENPGCCMDNDGDGVSNNVDKCPDYAGSVYNDGCPIDSMNINKINLQGKKTQLDPNNTIEQFRVMKNKDTIRNVITTKEDLLNLTRNKNIVTSHDVHFNHDEATLTEDEIRLFDRFFVQLANNERLSLIVIGHTDKDGSLDYNLILSKKRAETVKRKLIEYGFPENKIELYYYGEAKSLKKGSYSAEQKRMDRRVEIKVVSN